MSACDLVLVEGYKRADIPKLEIHRPSTGKPLLHPQDPNIVAVAADAPVGTPLPVLDLNDYDAIVAFVVGRLGLDAAAPTTAMPADPRR
jgi:molybdopterin-guanine dinucleotide biosynthesis protein B